jgi:nanoRNase/pAp phosphatase (c-di-AMP/oligoRNAs hydrolase)
MALEPVQQLKSIVTKVKNVLILLPQNPDGDAIGASWAFSFFLEKIGVNSSVAFQESELAKNRYFFLPTPDNLVSEIKGARDFVLLFNTQYNKISGVRSEQNKDELKIYITPEKGAIDPRDFSFVPASYKYDLIITIGVPDKESTGKTYEDNPDLFYEVPLVNIDHHNHNENFGQLNFVNLTASSSSEIVYEILNYIDESAMDEAIANCLLSGIISATDSFQKRNTTPKALQIAATLMGKGANQQEIVRYLYKTQTFQFLKLWGRVMARLKWDEKLKFVWSVVTPEDLVESRARIADLPSILEKIKSNYSEGDIFCILFPESFDSIKVLLKSTELSLDKIRRLDPNGTYMNDIFEFSLTQITIPQAEELILEKIKALGAKTS